MSLYAFGSSSVWLTPQVDALGNIITNPTPVIVGTMQDISVDISFDLKELYGQNTFPEDGARGKGKITGKAKFARFNGQFLNSVIFGQTMLGGLVTANYDTTGATIPSTPFTITPTPANSGTWSNDFGVIDSIGRPMTRVASAPTTGQYSVAAGVYTFAAADAGKTVFINYEYTVSAANAPTATQSTVMNVPMGYAPSFALDLFTQHNGKVLKLGLFKCMSSKFSLATKQDDYTIPEFDFSAYADSLGRVLKWNLSE